MTRLRTSHIDDIDSKGMGNGMVRIVHALAALVLIGAAMAVGSGGAWAAYGDQFGIAPINAHPDAVDTVPALPDEERAFWAGACDRASAPAPPAGAGDPPAPIPGGIGGIPSRRLAPASFFGGSQPTLAATSPIPEHCIDPGAPAEYGVSGGPLWRPSPYNNLITGPQASPCGTSFAPCWRLAPVTQAGARPDGTTTMSFNRGADGKVDGSVDNIYVDLPAGFVGNPNAVPKCTAEQFATRPLACPPETQVGILRFAIEAAPLGGANLGAADETAYPVYNLEPRNGRVAELGFGYASGERLTTVRLVGKARTSGDFGVTAFAGQIPAALPLISQTITLWGVPWAAANDVWRPKLGQFESQTCKTTPNLPAPLDGLNIEYVPPGGLLPSCRAGYSPSWGDPPAERAIKPFLTNETDCNPAPTVEMATDSYQNPGPFSADDLPLTEPGSHPDEANWKTYTSTSPTVVDCAGLDFQPDIEFDASSVADDASGLSVDLTIPQKNDPKDTGGAPLAAPATGATQGEIEDYVADATAYWHSPEGRATAHLRDTVVKLPPGMSVNPSAAAGLRGCSDSQIGVRGTDESGRLLFNDSDPFDGDAGDGVECPQSSIIGTVDVATPLLDEQLTGHVVLGQPKDVDIDCGNPPARRSSCPLTARLFLVIRNEERGLVAKIFGSSVAAPGSGQQTATFARNPELPFDHLALTFKGGPRGLLAMPQRCGSHGWTARFTPWSADGGGAFVDDGGAFGLTSRCAFGFAPKLVAGMSGRQARTHGKLSFRFTRQDGEGWVRGLTAELPPGLLAKVRGVTLCKSAQAAAGNCPTASRIGSVDGAAGSGTPFVLERKGDAYLTEGYRGGPYGLMVKVPVEAGPFRGDKALSPVIVRQKIEVDRTTAQVRAISDPLPLIHHGIPLRVRQITVNVDRPSFSLNPSDCAPKAIKATLTSPEGARAALSSPFQAAGCDRLPFKPKLALRLTGKRQMRTSGHPGVRAIVTQGAAEAGIELAQVRLPKTLALDPDNAQALCKFKDGTKPDLENHCPKGSIVGRARAETPLLERPLVGDVYFVENQKPGANGGVIKTLPMIIVALRGEIAVNLKGESSTTKAGKLVNTFAKVPDAPINKFNLNIAGGSNGILTVTRTRRTKFNLCSGKQIAEADIDGHNGKRYDRDIRMKTPCAKKKKARKSKGKRGRG
jgi:hypothetical protein